LSNEQKVKRNYFSEGVRLHEAGRLEEALHFYLKALEGTSFQSDILINIAAALHDLERYDEALEVYNQVLLLAPTSASAHHNRGNTLLAMERLQEAVESYRRAGTLLPESPEPLVPMGTALERMRRYKEAMECYTEALLRDPVCAEAHWNMALLNLLLGNYKDGWHGFEWRWKKKRYPTPHRNFSSPVWQGESFAGKTILIHAEQGLGDTIQFGRYISMVAELGGEIILEIPLPLTGLFKQMPGVVKIIQAGAVLPAFDRQIPLLSLPRIFGTTANNIPSRIPYLSAPVQHNAKWDMLLPRNTFLKVGIAWNGRKIPDPSRSCPSELLYILGGLENVQFYSLQMNEGDKPVEKPPGLPLIDLTAWINDFSDTAALMKKLDLIISIDTSVAHLAGSLGCSAWIMLPFAADWRWMLNREDSPWYPTMRLFRQTEAGGWRELIRRVRKELLHWSIVTESIADSCDYPSDFQENTPLNYYQYISGSDYYLGAPHDGRKVPFPQAVANINSDTPSMPDYYILDSDLYRLQNNFGIEGVRRFIQELPYFKSNPERHLFWTSHDNPVTPDETSIFCKTSVTLLEKGRIVAVPYPVEDLGALVSFDPEIILWQTCFVGYPGSSLIRERLLLSVAGSRSITASIDIAPKFHSHLDAETKEKRRQTYLDTLTQSLTVLCPRGDGINSIRFFEALSIGRIPVLISDCCALPFDFIIPYNRFIIRIAEEDAEIAGDLIGKWLDGKSPEDLLTRCREAREAWECWLSPAGTEKSLRIFLTALSAADYMQNVVSKGNSESTIKLGLRHYDEGNLKLAESCFNKAISEANEDCESTSCLALLLNEQGRFDETIELLTHRNTRKPDIPELIDLLGEAYQSAGMMNAAYSQFVQAVERNPGNSQTLMNIGVVCDNLNRQMEALSYLTRAAEIAPDNPQILLNLGGVLQSINQLNDAEICFRKALEFDPDYATAAWNLAQVLLLKGEYAEGFKLFEARFSKRDPVLRSPLDLPYWNGEPLGNRTIIVTTEQAFGDAIQFSRYTSLLAYCGADVIIFNHLEPLRKLLESILGVSTVVSDSAKLPPADFQIPMLSLPRLFGTTVDKIPAVVPYILPSACKVKEWNEKLPSSAGVRVGLVWAGRQLPDPRRSVSLGAFASLGEFSGIQFVSLQVGEGSEQALSPPAGMNFLDITSEIRDFEDTAALIANLDLVISVDTSVAHLAGAMGKPVWLMLPFSPDWRWFMERSDSPWYPSMKVFRQETKGEWGGVVTQLASQLKQFLISRELL
jgi:tetratricopeptide (TPR) repeat protein